MSSTESNRIVVVQLTCENMIRHEAHFGNNIVIPVDETAFNPIGGGISSSTAAKPKTCGLALAIVAIFCYFPGISLVASNGADGINNETLVGIVFMLVAGSLTVISIVFCIRDRRLSLKTKERQVQKAPVFGRELGKPLLSSRDECCTGSHFLKHQKGTGDTLCECDEIRLANKIEQSLTLKRYFADLDAASGPFDLDQEGMDRLTQNSMHCPPYHLPTPHSQLAKRVAVGEEDSSSDSAIYVDSDSALEDGVIVL